MIPCRPAHRNAPPRPWVTTATTSLCAAVRRRGGVGLTASRLIAATRERRRDTRIGHGRLIARSPLSATSTGGVRHSRLWWRIGVPASAVNKEHDVSHATITSGTGAFGRFLRLSVLGFCLLSGTQVYGDTVTPTADVSTHVVARASASAHSAAIGSLQPGRELELVGSVPYWHEVRLPHGSTGFVSKRWTRVIPRAFRPSDHSRRPRHPNQPPRLARAHAHRFDHSPKYSGGYTHGQVVHLRQQ